MKQRLCDWTFRNVPLSNKIVYIVHIPPDSFAQPLSIIRSSCITSVYSTCRLFFAYSWSVLYTLMIYSILALVFILFALYLLHVNSALSSVPSQVLSLSPNRFDPSQVVATYNKLKEKPVSAELPPKTGRRYIVVGGSGFLPGECPPRL